MRALSPFLWGRPWQLFGLSLPKEGRDDLIASCGLFGPGPEPVCRARPVDSTTAHKIQGPGLLAAPARTLLPRYNARSALTAADARGFFEHAGYPVGQRTP